jgi:hypothetical protein
MDWIKIDDYLFKSVDENGVETTYDYRNLRQEKLNLLVTPDIIREAEVDAILAQYALLNPLVTPEEIIGE